MAPRLLILLIYSVALCSASASTASENDHRRPMILHLHLTSSDDGRRLQRSEPNAHMRLHDDLLINGYYTTRLWIGTPPQMFALIVDTGSSVTYVPCSDCLDCGEHQDPRFKPESSTTYQPVKCNVNCNCDENGEQCMYERRYAEQSSSSGVLGEDVVSFGNESALTPQRAVFGCESFETGDLYTQRADGIMGLGRGELSMMDQLVAKGVISDSFSLCFGGMGLGGGTMVLGRIKSPRDMVFAESDPNRSPYYNIELKGIHVAGKALNLNSDVFDQKYGTVLDSGTTYTYLPKDAFIEFKNAIMKETHDLKQIDGPDLNYNDICFSTAGRDVTQLSKVFPQVDMVFSKGNKFSLSHENYLFPHKKVNGAYCLGVFENEDPTTLLGGIFVRNTLVTYDREDNKVGFWKTNCSELWKSLNHENAPVSAPGPASTDWNLRRGISPDIAPAPAPTDWDLSRGISPDIASAPASTDENLNGWVSPYISPAPASNDWDLNGGISPDIASGGLPPTDLPAEGQIGQISFDLMFNISTSTEPNFTELSESIARGLEVKISQVHLKNFNMSEVGLLIRWTIVPDESANRFSTEKAKNIRVHLMRHEMQLPHEFGTYELTKLNFQRKRSWWEQHSWMVAVGVSVASVLALSALGAWLIWRNRSRRGISFEPVGGISGATASEQELQPLR